MDLFVMMAILVGLFAVVMLVIVVARLVSLLRAGNELPDKPQSEEPAGEKTEKEVDRLLSQFEQNRDQNDSQS